MRIEVKRFAKLTNSELFNIYKARAEVFVVEQKCAYLDVDDIDLRSLHFSLYEENKLAAYLRVFEKEEGIAQIGRVLTTIRSKGYGQKIMEEAMTYIKALQFKKVYLEAQCYAIGFYEKFGFKVTSDPFDEDGIPHVKMECDL